MDLDRLLDHAVRSRASDVHLKVGRPPILRRDGELNELDDWPALTHAQLDGVVARICAGAEARLRGFEATGELDIAYTAAGDTRFRVNGFRQRGAVSLAFRPIPTEVPTLADLGLPRGVERLAEERHGLVAVAGPTGGGKSTTLAAMLQHINRRRRAHVVTIEDPIEFLHRDDGCIINQREVGLDTESFRRALRQVLRQDPDVIVIGELRDAESAETALQAAESGHLVLTSLHTIDAAETIARTVEFFPPTKQPQIRAILAGVLRGVVSQRLLPRIDGGRVPAVEVMFTNTRIGDLIRENKADGIPSAIAEGSFFDMQTLERALVDLVVEGTVDRDVAAAAAVNQHNFLISLDQALKQRAVSEGADFDEVEPEPQHLGGVRLRRG